MSRQPNESGSGGHEENKSALCPGLVRPSHPADPSAVCVHRPRGCERPGPGSPVPAVCASDRGHPPLCAHPDEKTDGEAGGGAGAGLSQHQLQIYIPQLCILSGYRGRPHRRGMEEQPLPAANGRSGADHRHPHQHRPAAAGHRPGELPVSAGRQKGEDSIPCGSRVDSCP